MQVGNLFRKARLVNNFREICQQFKESIGYSITQWSCHLAGDLRVGGSNSGSG